MVVMGLPDYAEGLVLYRWGYSAGAHFFLHVPIGTFTFGADRDNSTPWYPGVAAPFTFQLGKAKCFHAYTYRRYVSFSLLLCDEGHKFPIHGKRTPGLADMQARIPSLATLLPKFLL